MRLYHDQNVKFQQAFWISAGHNIFEGITGPIAEIERIKSGNLSFSQMIIINSFCLSLQFYTFPICVKKRWHKVH